MKNMEDITKKELESFLKLKDKLEVKAILIADTLATIDSQYYKQASTLDRVLILEKDVYVEYSGYCYGAYTESICFSTEYLYKEIEEIKAIEKKELQKRVKEEKEIENQKEQAKIKEEKKLYNTLKKKFEGK